MRIGAGSSRTWLVLRFALEWDRKALRGTPRLFAWEPKIGKKQRGRGLSGGNNGFSFRSIEFDVLP